MRPGAKSGAIMVTASGNPLLRVVASLSRRTSRSRIGVDNGVARKISHALYIYALITRQETSLGRAKLPLSRRTSLTHTELRSFGCGSAALGAMQAGSALDAGV